MDTSFYYMIFFLGIFAFPGLFRLFLLLLKCGSRRLTFLLTRYLRYPVLIQLRHWNAVTRLNALYLLFYIACNCLALAIYVKDVRELEQRAARLAVINLTVLFLGGRTNPGADLLGISIQSYYLAHHWIGRIAAAEGVIHAIIVITLRPRLSAIAISGSIVFFIFAILLVSTIYFLRGYQGDLFHPVHTFLAVTSLVGLIWHSFLLNSALGKVLSLTAMGIWISTTLYRLFRILNRGRGVKVIKTKTFQDVTVIKVKTTKPMRVFPGAYFYVYFPGSLTSRLMIAVWYKPSEQFSQVLSFIVHHHRRHARYLKKLSKDSELILEGPYGQDLQLQGFENVCLVAKGVGILSVLPIAHHLAARNANDETVARLSADLSSKETTLESFQRKVESEGEELKATEEELRMKRDDLQRALATSSGGISRRLDKFRHQIETEERLLDKERKELNKKGKDLAKQKTEVDVIRKKLRSTEFYNDTTKTIDILWHLDHNSQRDWAFKYLQHLRDLDPEEILFMVRCYFPSHDSENSKEVFEATNQWACTYPSDTRLSFGDSVTRTLESISLNLSGETIIVACGDGRFISEIRSNLAGNTHTERLFRFVEAKYQPLHRALASFTSDSQSIV